MDRSVRVSRVEQLFQSAQRAEAEHVEWHARRHQFLQDIGNLLEAPLGYWGWGRGNPIDSTITPIASSYYGFSRSVWPAVVEFNLGPESVRLWSMPIRQRMADRPHVTVSRSMLHTDEAWEAESDVRRRLSSLGIEHLLVSVCYFRNDSWFNITLCRAPGQPDYSTEDADLLQLSLSCVGWMQPQLSETVAADSFRGLSTRKRTVILSLLDGKSRKQIARDLGLSPHTVNDHIKEIYERFRVNSVTELAATFLKNG